MRCVAEITRSCVAGGAAPAVLDGKGDEVTTFVPDEVRERNIARDLRHTPEVGEGSGGWVMSVRYLVEALAAARAELKAPPLPSERPERELLRRIRAWDMLDEA